MKKIVVLTQTSRELPKENKSQSHQPALNRAKTFHIEFQGQNLVYNENFNSGSKFLKFARKYQIHFSLFMYLMRFFKASFSISVSGRWINFIFKNLSNCCQCKYDHVNFPDFSILFLEGFEFQGQQLGLATKTLWPHQVKCSNPSFFVKIL